MVKKVGFIFSLPRSGSTFVQRVLSQGEGVATSSEPWVLPCLGAIRYGEPPAASFGYDHARVALADLAERHNAEKAWDQSIRCFVENFYGSLAGPNDQIFIDKTPRNAAFAQDILRIFPEAPVLFLWRNPLAVVDSINNTWAAGSWKAYFYKFDLDHCLKTMVEAYENSKHESRVLSMRYEDICSEPEARFKIIFDHFGTTFYESFLDNVPKMEGTLGDKVGQDRYQGVRRNPSASDWSIGFQGVCRYIWAVRYLSKIGGRRLSVMGYDWHSLRKGLRLRSLGRLSDYVYVPLAPIYHVVEPYLLRTKIQERQLRRYARR